MFKSSFKILLLALLIASSFSKTFASHVQPDSLLHGQPQTPFTVSTANTTANKMQAIEVVAQSEFHQELQWRILNLLAQQLFDDHMEHLASYLFMNKWRYQTSSFSVNITSMNPELLEVKITDSGSQDETRLEIERVN